MGATSYDMCLILVCIALYSILIDQCCPLTAFYYEKLFLFIPTNITSCVPLPVRASSECVCQIFHPSATLNWGSLRIVR